jgi:hypothetical protein
MRRIDLSIILIGLISIVGAAAVFYSTPWGIGISTDSVTYLMAARNLSAGLGLSLWTGSSSTQPLTHFPPLYPLLLAGMARLGLDPLAAARGLNALLFAANIASFGLVLRHCASGSRWTGVLGAFLVFSASFMLELHATAWTEPLFILCGIWSLFILYRHLEQPRRTVLFSAGLLAALACLTRYIGVVLVVTGLIGALWLSREALRRRLIDGGIWVVVSAAPLLAWLVRNERLVGTGVDRQLALHLLSLAQVKTGLLVFSTWLVPQGLSNTSRQALLLFVVAICLGMGAYLWRRRKIEELDLRPITLPLLFTLIYLASLGLSISFLDAQIPVNSRLLSPLWVAGLFSALYLADGLLFQVEGIRALKTLLLGSLLLVCGLYLQNAVSWISQSHRQGLGYASPGWIESDLVEKVRLLPPETPVYSNAPEVIYFFSGIYASPLPLKWNPNSLRPNPLLDSELSDMGAKLRGEKSVLVIFDALKGRAYYPTEAEISEETPLRLIAATQDGMIYTGQNGP